MRPGLRMCFVLGSKIIQNQSLTYIICSVIEKKRTAKVNNSSNYSVKNFNVNLIKLGRGTM